MPDPYIWPTELDDAGKLLGVVGSFWAGSYAGNELVGSLLYAKARAQAQAHLDLLELIASISRFDVPVFHKENWTHLELLESDKNDGNLATFDGAYAFDGTLRFDVPIAGRLHSWPAPAGLAAVNAIMDRIAGATVTYSAGIDFYLRDGYLWFREDPFEAAGVRISEIFDGGAVTDRVAHLWAYGGEYDWGSVYKQFGYVLNLKLASSKPYKEIVNAVYDGLVEGTSARCVEDLMSAICDVPLSKEDETVLHILSDSSKLWVITDKNAYGFSPLAVPIVAVGDTLSAGDQMTDALRFYELNRGGVPEGLRAITLGRGLRPADYFWTLGFSDTEVPLVVEEDVDGYTRVEFALTGWPGDTAKFWDDLHARGIAADDTLAMRLDTRTNKTGQPSAANLPIAINPLKFLVENVFRGNAFAISVRPEAFGPDSPGLHNASLLRKLVPPGTACFVSVTLEYDGDIVTMDGPGDERTSGFEEDVDLYLANTIEETLDPASYIPEDVKIFQIGGYCK